MTESGQPDAARSASWDIDPRRSLAAAAMWLIIALAITFSIAAAVWVGSIARANVVEQHVRRLALETDQLSSDFGQALAARLGALRAARTLLRDSAAADRETGLRQVFDELVSAYPDLDWIAIADSSGAVAGANGDLPDGSAVGASDWFIGGVQGPWLGVIDRVPGRPADAASLGDMAAPVQDKTGRVVGVIAAHLTWRRPPNHPLRLTEEPDPRSAAQAYVLNRDGAILIGPGAMRGTAWNGVAVSGENSAAGILREATPAMRFERLPDGRKVLVSRAPLSAGGGVSALGWQVLLCEPNERVFQRADALALRIFWVSLCLGVATVLLGTLGARHLTRRLKSLTLSVAAVGRSEGARIEVPAGQDEVAQLGGAFAKILDDLQQERRDLKSLSSELERRVAVRTSEVERLAEESRFAAIVRERLTIARDLHDTLAHSMMAMLSEIRFLRRLQAHDPSAVPAELAHAEEVAHEGLKEARNAITQMRVNTVRETGLGPALSNAFGRFIDRTGIAGEFTADIDASRFGDERAETVLRMAQEALRNVERHARAARVDVTLRIRGGATMELRIEDNGVGFDPGEIRPGHYGIVGLREQAELIGAQLRIDSRLNEGTKLTLSLPLSPVTFAQSP
jgi:signal transduction histidine kinase